MNRLIFFLIVILIFCLIDYYVWQAVKYLIRNLNGSLRLIISVLYWALPVIIISGVILKFAGIQMEERLWRFIVMGGFVLNFAPKFVVALFVLLDDLFRGGKTIVTKIQESDVNSNDKETIGRSDFLLKSGLLVGSVPFVATTFGIISGVHDYRVRKSTVYYPNLPKEFDGIRLAQISDIHSGSFFNKVAVKGGIDMLNAEKPDLVFFTGDLVNDRADEVRNYIDIFDKIKAPLGVHSVLGNHDYGDYVAWGSEQAKVKNLQNVITAHKEMGWNIMLNENKSITVDGADIGLIGVENWGKGFKTVGDLSKAYQGMEEKDFKILLSHDPSHWREQVIPGFSDIDLTLSGHTHGMQFGIEIGDFKWSPVQYRYKEWAGLYTEGKQNIYVNRGYGFLAFPGRVGILPEITILELKRGVG